ncbi:hypothetical protein DFH07DRAFT_1059018 [Mycena maculata]|uniref:F-box domain-containing protein n=1 Tax=Mycena maculata TaxID=230809 RepID=A0AAD7NLA0_9AGAR|nr:hypothetical protein DFH07DRAFT_1059018 [Mycena maculata]
MRPSRRLNALLNSAFLDLVNKRETIRERIAEFVPPVQSLPTELLEEIFTFASPSPEELRGFTPHEAPWSLTKVCRRWRTIAESLPTLWTTVALIDPSWRYPLPLLRRQIKLSGNRPLRIHFHSARSFDCVTSLLRLLVQESSRWQLADLRIGYDEPFILNSVRGRVPLLRSLRIEPPLLNDFYACFASAPLRHLTISNASPSLALPWSELISYDGTGPAVQTLRILKKTSKLLQCRLQVFACREASTLPHVLIPRLRKIYVQDAQILGWLVLPALEELFLLHDCVGLVLSLVRRSSCNLDKLFTFEGHTPGAVAQILAHCSSITELGMQVGWDDAAALSVLLYRLTPRGGSYAPCLAPNLTAISFAGCITAHDVTFTQMVDMVAARWLMYADGACQRLKFLGLFMDDVCLNPALRQSFGRLEMFRREGLQVYIMTGPEARWNNGRVPDCLSHWLDPITD